MDKEKIYKKLTENLIKVMESGVKPWEKMWSANMDPMPNNPITGTRYSGINVVFLWASQMVHGFSSNRFATFKQIAERGGKIKKGSKSTPIAFYKMLEVERSDGETDKIPMIKYYNVFNADQIDGLDIGEEQIEDFEHDPIEQVEFFLAGIDHKIEWGGNQPCYVPSVDFLRMPKPERFKTRESFYSTYLHELSHWTGHESRLNRLKPGKKEYAFEELVAELSAVFLCAQLGIEYNLENHASYLESWVKCLKEEPRFIFQASSKAKKASEYLLELSETNEQMRRA